MVGSRLKEIRKEKGVTQKVLASVIGVTETAVSMYETGINDPNDNVKLKIASYFGVSLDYLIGTIDDRVMPYNRDTFLILPNVINKNYREILLRFVNVLDETDDDGKVLLSEFMEFINNRSKVRD